MKKVFTIIILFLSFLLNISYANEIDYDYQQEILNTGYLYNTSGFFEAIRHNDIKTVELFLHAGINPNTTFSGTPAVIYALFLNKLEIMDILLFAGADVETQVPALWVAAKPHNLMSLAIKRKNPKAVEILIKHGVDVNKKFNGEYPINYAAKIKQEKIVQILLNAGAKQN